MDIGVWEMVLDVVLLCWRPGKNNVCGNGEVLDAEAGVVVLQVKDGLSLHTMVSPRRNMRFGIAGYGRVQF